MESVRKSRLPTSPLSALSVRNVSTWSKDGAATNSESKRPEDSDRMPCWRSTSRRPCQMPGAFSSVRRIASLSVIFSTVTSGAGMSRGTTGASVAARAPPAHAATTARAARPPVTLKRAMRALTARSPGA